VRTTDILALFTTQQLLDELKSRKLNTETLHKGLGDLVDYVRTSERNNGLPWPWQYQEGDGEVRHWSAMLEERASAEHAPSPEQVVAAAIQTIHSVRFVLGRAPTREEETSTENAKNILNAYYAGATLIRSGKNALYLRDFQKYGVSSLLVAAALRLGLLCTVTVEEQ
jgi:hypothetical protein